MKNINFMTPIDLLFIVQGYNFLKFNCNFMDLLHEG